jgi:hypothetical protein
LANQSTDKPAGKGTDQGGLEVVDDWEVHFEHLCVFQREHGHLEPTTMYNACPKLARWVPAQRRMHRRLRLTPYKKEKLEQLGFNWEGQHHYSYTPNEVWESHFNKLASFREQHRHFGTSLWGNMSIGLEMWTTTQRTMYQEGRLDKGRVMHQPWVHYSFTHHS